MPSSTSSPAVPPPFRFSVPGVSVGAYVEDGYGTLVPQEFAVRPHKKVFYQTVAKLSVASCQTHGVVRVVRKPDRAGKQRWMITDEGIEDPRTEPWWLVAGHSTPPLNHRFNLIVNQDFDFHYLRNHEIDDGSHHMSFLAIVEPDEDGIRRGCEHLSDLDRLVIEKSILHYIKINGLK